MGWKVKMNDELRTILLVALIISVGASLLVRYIRTTCSSVEQIKYTNVLRNLKIAIVLSDTVMVVLVALILTR